MTDFLIVPIALLAIGAYVLASWLIAKSSRYVVAGLIHTDKVLTNKVSAIILVVIAFICSLMIWAMLR